MIERPFDGFDWDAGNLAKCQGHGMSRSAIESVFAGTPLVGPDPFVPAIEQRWRAIGRTDDGRPAFVVSRCVKLPACDCPAAVGALHARQGSAQI